MKKIFLIGSNSYLSKKLINRFNKEKFSFITVSSTSNNSDIKLDLNHVNRFNFDVLRKNDLVIFLSAISSPDKCQKEFKTSFKINVTGTIKFIEESLNRKVNVLFFSSDTVFGSDNGQNDEDTLPISPVGEYAFMKLSVENYFKNEPNFKIFRLSYVFSWDDKFMQYLHHCKNKNIIAEIFHPFTRKMVYVQDVIDGILKLVNKWDSSDMQIFNFCGSSQYSRLDIVRLYNKIVATVNYEISKPPIFFYKARPHIIYINSKYTESLIGRPFTKIEDAIKIEKLNN